MHPGLIIVMLNVVAVCVKAARKAVQPKAISTNQSYGLTHSLTGIKIQGSFSFKVFSPGQTSFTLSSIATRSVYPIGCRWRFCGRLLGGECGGGVSPTTGQITLSGGAAFMGPKQIIDNTFFPARRGSRSSREYTLTARNSPGHGLLWKA